MPINLKPKCLYDGVHYGLCPNNNNGKCKTIYKTMEGFFLLFHKFDGKNYIKCLCG